jgi:hypothetical protein
MMKSTLHIALETFPDYILKEAEILVASLGEIAPNSDYIYLRLGKNDILYQVEFRVDYVGEHFSSLSKSRYLKDALEDSFTKILNLLYSFNSPPEDESLTEVTSDESLSE